MTNADFPTNPYEAFRIRTIAKVWGVMILCGAPVMALIVMVSH